MKKVYVPRKMYIKAIMEIVWASGTTCLEKAQMDFDMDIIREHGRDVEVDHEGLSSSDYALLRAFVEADDDSPQAESAYESLLSILEEG